MMRGFYDSMLHNDLTEARYVSNPYLETGSTGDH